MTHFVHHEPCPKCGSKDNLARYSDGSGYCFGCHFVDNKNFIPYKEEPKEKKYVSLPDDVSREYSYEAVAWFSQYGLNLDEILPHAVWSNSRKQLIFPWYDEENNLIAYQARNFNSNKRYYSSGPLADLYAIYRAKKSLNKDRIILVEDCLSAIKISRHCDAMAILTSNISKEKLRHLKYYYNYVTVFLDGNMYTNAMKIADRLSLLGMKSDVIYSNKDPKEHDDLEILLKGNTMK